MTQLISSKNILSSITFTFLLLTPFFVSAQTSIKEQSNSETHISIMDGRNSFQLFHKGSVEVSDDNTEILSISPNGHFEFIKKEKGKKKKVRIESDHNGKLTYQFFIGRKKTPYLPEGKMWMTRMLPEIVNNTNLGGVEKMRKLYDAQGFSGVLSEVNNQQEDHLQMNYYEFLLKQDLTDEALESTIQSAINSLEKEHYLSELLEDNHRAILKAPKGPAVYLDGINSLKKAHYQSELLEDYIKYVNIDVQEIDALMEIINSFDSEHYKAEAIEEIAERKNIKDDALAIVITRSMESLNSAHYKNEIIDEILDHHELESKSMSALLDAIQSIDSDHHFAEIIDNIAESQKLNEQELTDLIFALRHLRSDHHLSESLQELADDVMHYQGTALDAYKEIAKNIKSSHYYQEVMDALE